VGANVPGNRLVVRAAVLASRRRRLAVSMEGLLWVEVGKSPQMRMGNG
jgi:hypothetical protein